jgi:hypothetical protein
MQIRSAALVAACAFSFAVASTSPAHAQATTVVVGGQPPAAPAVPPGYVPAPQPGYAQGYGPGYTTPLYQQTQPSYVPQSVALSGPRIIKDWSEGEPIPPGYHESVRARKGLIIGGAVLFGTMYLISAFAAAAETDLSSCGCHGGLFIPGAGPFVELGHSGGATASLFLVLDGVSQVGGIAMFIAGFAAPQTVLVRNDMGSKGRLHLALSPIIGPDRSGMGVVGTF